MKKIFSIFLICCAAFTYAEEEPVFEETDENVNFCAYGSFTAEEPIFEEDETTADYRKECDDECEDPEHDHLILAQRNSQSFGENRGNRNCFWANCGSWTRYRAGFGVEKAFIRFPQSPTIIRGSSLVTAYAYDYDVLYSLSGYFPPLGSINPLCWFDEILYSMNNYPFTLLNRAIFQAPNGDWVMDYVAHDCMQNLITKGRAIVTPFNGYTIQCTKPNGMYDYFDYFLDNFYIRCEL